MTAKQINDSVKRIFPDLGEVEIISLINDYISEFAKRTRCCSKTIEGDATGSADEQTLVTVADQRLYQLPADLLYIRRVDYDGDGIMQMNIEETVEQGDTA